MVRQFSHRKTKDLFRIFSQQENYLYDSFETISASGKNGAIIHYK